MTDSKVPIDSILARLFNTHEAGAANDPELEQWLNESEDNRIDFERYRKICQAGSRLGAALKYSSTEAFKKVDSRIQHRAKQSHRFRRIILYSSGAAAVLLVLFTLKVMFWTVGNNSGMVAVKTQMGDRSEVILPDGSEVFLNAGSQLNYQLDACNCLREVSFSGEAFFHVAKSKMPFVITTPSGLQVKVLGTKFNLHAYSDEEDVETTLVEGSVKLSSSNSPESVTMSPGQIATYSKSTGRLQLRDGSPEHELSWMENKLYMDNMNLGEVCVRLERWYNVNIDINGAGLNQNIHYTGVLSEESITDVLDALCQLSPIKYSMKGNKVVITKK